MAEPQFDFVDSENNPLPIEEDEDGLFAIGDPDAEDEDFSPELREHDANLLSSFPEDKVKGLGSELHSLYMLDVDGRKAWQSTYEKGLKSLQQDDVARTSEKSSARRIDSKLSKVVHPLIAEAATRFQAKAIGELFPPAGPVGTTIVGEASVQTQEQGRRVSTYMNYQVTEEMEEYFPDLDQMLFHLPLVGHAFKKAWMDVNLQRVTSRYVHAEDLIVEPSAVDLQSAVRYTHKLRLYPHEFDQYVANDFYDKIELPTNSTLEQTTPQEIDQLSIQEQKDGKRLFLEMHVYLDLMSKEGESDKPFVVTIEADTQQVVSIRRNWDEPKMGVENFKKNVWFVSYKFLPGLGFYGYGLFHIIGGLAEAATGSLRALLDSAAFANMQGGFKLKGRVQGGEMEVSPGEFTDIAAAVDDIKKAIMPLPFKEPSQTMMALLQYVVETGKQFASTVETSISDANQNTPVGTTVALLEEHGRVFSAVHKRLHNSQRADFKLIGKLNGIYLPDRYPYKIKETNEVIMRADFDDRVDIIPVSDPSTFSSTQRIAQSQMMLQMTEKFPEYHNKYKAIKRMYEATRIPNFDEVLRDPTQAERMDAVAENTMMMMGRPVKVYEDQDHMSHMSVLDDWFKRLPPDFQQIHGMAYAAHRSEHMALYYRAMIQQQMQAPMPPLANPDDDIQETPPQVDAMISQAAAQLILQNPQGQKPIGPPPPELPDPKKKDEGGDQNSAESAQASAQAIMMKAQADIQTKQMKAQSDMQITQAKAQLDMKIDMLRERGRQQENRMRQEGKQELDQQKLDVDIAQMWEKLDNELEVATQRAQSQINTQETQAQVSGQIQLESARTSNSIRKLEAASKPKPSPDAPTE